MIARDVSMIDRLGTGLEIRIQPQSLQVVCDNLLVYSTIHSDKIGICTFAEAWQRAGEVVERVISST